MMRSWAGRFTSTWAGVVAGNITAAISDSLAQFSLDALAKQFANTGSTLDDMSKRTGFAAEQLSALDFAADQSGVTLQELEKAIKFMQKGGFGSGFADLLRLADEITNMADPAMRTARAMQVFGKSGTSILPLLGEGSQGLRELIDLADKLSVIMGGNDVKAAAKLDDSLAAVNAQFKAMQIAIGSAVAPVLQELIDTVQPYLAKGIQWIKQNRQLVLTILKVSAAVVALAAAAAGIAVALSLAASAVAAFKMLALTPLLFAVKAAWLYFKSFFTWWNAAWQAFKLTIGMKLLEEFGSKFMEIFGQVRDFVSDVWRDLAAAAVDSWEGIADAISAGDLELAGKIAMKGLEVAWASTTNKFTTLWIEFVNLFKRAWNQVTGDIAKGLVVISAEAEKALNAVAGGGAAGGLFGGDPNEIQRQIDAKNLAVDARKNAMLGGIDAATRAENKAIAAQLPGDIKALDNELAALRAELAELNGKARMAAAAAPDFGGPNIGEALRMAGVGLPGMGAGGGSSTGTFSGEAASRLSGGSSVGGKLDQLHVDLQAVAAIERQAVQLQREGNDKLGGLVTD